jgi:hypothetical protein
MSKKSIDQTFVKYNIRKEDLQLIETLCAQHDLSSEWVKGLLESFQTAATQDKPLDDAGLKKLLDKELQKIKTS